MEFIFMYFTIGIVFIGIGLLMKPVARKGPNGWIGIRIPQTMEDKRVWRDVHLASIPWWISIGLADIAMGLATYFFAELQTEAWIWLHITSPMVMIAALLIWSIFAANASQKKWRERDKLGIDSQLSDPIEPE